MAWNESGAEIEMSDESKAAIVARPSAFNNALGIRLSDWSDGRCSVELDVIGDHLNRSGVVHGGVLMTLLDVACGYAGTWTEAQDGARPVRDARSHHQLRGGRPLPAG